MTKFGIRMAIAVAACAAVGLGGCLGEDTKESAKKAGEEAVAAAKSAAQDAVDAGKEAAAVAKEKAGEAAEAVKEAASAATDKAKEVAAAAADKATEVADAAKDKAAEVKAAAEEKVAEAEKAAEPAKPAEPAAAAETPAAAPAAAPAADTDTPAEREAKKAAADKAALEHHNADVKFEDARYRLADGTPTYKVTDGKVDWASWEGFRRYHDACHVCHGPNALGGSFAPNLADSLKTMSYEDFVAVVSAGRVANRGGTQYVMPALGGNPDVMCYLDDIYTYIKGRSAYELTGDAKNAIPPGRPIGREDISDEARAQKKDCLPD